MKEGERRLTAFYGFSDVRQRMKDWDLFHRLGEDQELPWIVCGDLNEIV